MPVSVMDKQSLVADFKRLSVFRLGEFTLKNGFKSPIYVDCRVLISHPKQMKSACDALWQCISANNLQYDYVCGVPYGAVPYASVLSVDHNIPMITRRKEVKDYGTKKCVEGSYEKGKRVLVIEDVITTGSSIVDTVQVLRDEGLIVEDVIVLLDRQQGAEITFKRANLNAHRVLVMDDVLQYLVDNKEIDDDRRTDIKAVLKAGAVTDQQSEAKQVNKYASLQWRMDNCSSMHPVAKRLMALVHKKQSNLCVAADFDTADAVLDFAQRVGAHIVLLKLHANMIRDATPDTFDKLRKCANQLEFMLFEDCKLADTATTVFGQLAHSPFQILKWADVITVHGVPGDGLFDGMHKAFVDCGREIGALVVAEMSCKNSLTALPSYTKDCVALAEKYASDVLGFICQKKCSDNKAFVFVTPGIHLHQTGDDQSQQFRSPYHAISEDGNDIVVVGRGITKATEPEKAVLEYKTAAWKALQEREAIQ